MKLGNKDGDGLGTLWKTDTKSQTSPNKHSPGTHREREEQVDQETPDINNSKQTPVGWATHGNSFKNNPGQGTLESCCQQPMPREGRQA